MTDYYVDLDNPGAWNTRDGTDHTGNQWLGLSGLQKAADAITAGNTINIKGTVVCTNLLDVSHDAWSATALTLGEACSWTGGTGVVSEPNTSDVSGIVIEKLTGNNPVDDEVITGGTSGQTVTVDASASSVKSTGLDVDTNGGSMADGPVKYIGVNSSWVNDSTRCKLDGNAGAIAGCDDTIYSTVHSQYFENVEVDDADDDGFDAVTADGHIYVNCWAHHCDGEGFRIDRDTTFIRCLSNNNLDGFRTSYAGRFIGCIAHNNTSKGYNQSSTGGIFVGCIAADNTADGIYAYNTQSVIFCVLDENGDGIKQAYSSMSVFMFNRITNQTDDGLVAGSGTGCYEDWNLFYGNTGDDYDDTAGAGLIEKGGNSKTDSASDGYSDQTNHDFNLASTADYRREVIALPKWDGSSP